MYHPSHAVPTPPHTPTTHPGPLPHTQAHPTEFDVSLKKKTQKLKKCQRVKVEKCASTEFDVFALRSKVKNISQSPVLCLYCCVRKVFFFLKVSTSKRASTTERHLHSLLNTSSLFFNKNIQRSGKTPPLPPPLPPHSTKFDVCMVEIWKQPTPSTWFDAFSPLFDKNSPNCGSWNCHQSTCVQYKF
jgi:hypothetical protein